MTYTGFYRFNKLLLKDSLLALAILLMCGDDFSRVNKKSIIKAISNLQVIKYFSFIYKIKEIKRKFFLFIWRY